MIQAIINVLWVLSWILAFVFMPLGFALYTAKKGLSVGIQIGIIVLSRGKVLFKPKTQHVTQEQLQEIIDRAVLEKLDEAEKELKAKPKKRGKKK